MSPFQNTRPREQGLFSAEEVESLMRVEFERSQRHGLPLVCMLLGVDRLGQLQDLYGTESREEILQSIVDALKGATRESDLLCFQQDDRLIALFPHTAPEVGILVAKKLLAAARKMRFERDGRSLRVSLSIGISHNRHKHAISFDTLVAVAEEGLAVADAGGGDRYVETELYQLYEKKRKARERDVEGGERMQIVYVPAAPGPAAPPAPSPASLLGETVLEILAARGVQVSDPGRLDRDALLRMLLQLQDERAHPAHGELVEERRRNEILERRIHKLSQELGVTEDELRRIAALKSVDPGIASIYKGVQGLGEDAQNREKKREMMQEIFQANFELKRQLGSIAKAT